jgi:nucleoside-diphosphate-sugar epimerase
MKRTIIFGGTGYIGTMLARHFAASGRFDEIILADVKPPTTALPAQCRFVECDVRKPISEALQDSTPEWIFNFAAVHREPGHAAHEYFDTNLRGARHVVAFAERTACTNLYFTSSIASYGPTTGPTDENSPNYPVTPYGISKHAAELIHEVWLRAATARRLIVCRPGVIYGPGDPGNILRMIRAVKKGVFFFPGNPHIHKSYGYIHGLLASIDFMMARAEPHLIYNYVERETEPLADLVRISGEVVKKNARIVRLPRSLLCIAAEVVQTVTGGKSPIHPVRVRKAATPTHIVPTRLKELGFKFEYDFRSSLAHWLSVSPQDFE